MEDGSASDVSDLIDDEDDVGECDMSVYHRQREEELSDLAFVRALHRRHQGCMVQEENEEHSSSVDSANTLESNLQIVDPSLSNLITMEENQPNSTQPKIDSQKKNNKRRKIPPAVFYKTIEELPETDFRRKPFVPPQLSEIQSDAVNRKMSLLTRKQVYPYEYIDGFEKFLETDLPNPSAFKSTLKGEDISEEDYAHARKVWEEFEIETLGMYHDLYLLTDVLLLADVFEAFCKMCYDNYGLDPTYSYTGPGFAWQAALKMTKVKLELLTDADMHLFVERAIRGGVSTISQRLARAN